MSEEKNVFIRADLMKTTSGNTAWYRMDKKMVEFLNLVEERLGKIEAINLDRKEDGSIGFNIGIICSKKNE